MINLDPVIERIGTLLDEDTDQSVTYAALEARLALERVCYDRLRQRHDYISHEQLRRWQPGAVVNTLIKEVDEHLGKTLTLSISKSPVRPGVKLEDEEYVEVGTEIGFNPKRIAKLWNALAKLALHAHLPEHRNDAIPAYGDRPRIRAKVEEVQSELRRLAKGTMTFSGLGEEVKFTCSCGELNKRRAGLLRDGQHAHCLNPECKQTWNVTREDDGFGFEQVTVPVNCEACSAANHMPWRFFLDMKHDEVGSFSCHSCRHKNYVQWRLMQVHRESSDGCQADA
jgi:hypothetical protein